MIDLNHILLFIAAISPLVMLAQTLRRGAIYRPWRLAAITVLVVTGGAWLVARDVAGYVGAGAWLVLLLIPSIGIRKISELASHQRYRSAARWAGLIRYLHPSSSLRVQAELHRALGSAQDGKFAEALTRLAPLRNNQTNAGRQAIAQSYRLKGEWANLVGWANAEVPAEVRRGDFAFIPLYLRALGETGAHDDLVLEFATILSGRGFLHQPSWSYYPSLVVVLAFCGRLRSENGMEALRRFSKRERDFWLATNDQATGNFEAARGKLEQLRGEPDDKIFLSDIAQRLEASEATARPNLSPPTFALLHRIKQNRRPPASAFASEFRRPTVAVMTLIVLNVVMFLVEVKMGGSTSALTLHRLGALEPWAVRYGGQYWRMLTALFLHFGALHLVFNLYALYVIGPGLERITGAVRFALLYLVAGLGSSAGVLLLRFANYSRPEQLVGASGCVMGVVGAWAGYLLRHRREPFAGRRLANIGLIVAIQTAFDLSTPQISMVAHMSGLVCGVLLGLLIRGREL